MPDENDLRRLLAAADAPHQLDPAKIVARSRRRRLPRQLAAGAIGVLAIAGVGVLAVNVSTLQNPAFTSADESSMSDSVPESGSELEASKQGGADTLNVCGAPIAAVDPTRSGLMLTVELPSIAPAGEPVEGVVRMTNASSESIDGFAFVPPTIAVSNPDVVVALGTADPLPGDAAVSLAPGESLEYPVTLSLSSCATEGEPLAPGPYVVSAAVDFTPAELQAGEPALADLVGGPLTSITLD